MTINDIVYGFKLVRKETVVEAGSEAYIFEHEKSGAKLLYMENDDDNKVFSASFRTPPADDTGVPHIIEHSTLCGSRKFPLKEPFVELVKGSLNTFLNAMTYPDKTMYPIASLNDKDFHNLMDVYLDAVFYPSIYDKPEILLQEGWHYEIEKPEEPLKYSGVVFNEMKGALSDPADQLNNEIFSAIFPDTIYSNESGGNPVHIPELTYEQFKEFHRKYYSPANCYLFLYGKMDIEEQLKFIDEEYLSNFDRVEVDSHIEAQKPFAETVIHEAEYPVGADDDTSAKTFLNYSAVIGETCDSELVAAMTVLCKSLLQSEASPVRQALVDADLGLDVDGSFEDSVRQPVFSVTITGSEPDKLDEFKNVLMNSFKEQVEKGIDKTLLEASLNNLEFRLRESDFGTAPKGLIFNIIAMSTWLYDFDPLMALRYENVLKKLRDGIKSDYYEKILQKYVIENAHSAFVVMKPSKTLAAEREKKIADILAEKKAKMTAEEIQDIINTTARLKEMQQTPDSPEALATIPLLEISDISPDSIKYPLEERKLDGNTVLFSNVDTSGIAYMSLCFDIKTVPQDMLQYANLLEDLLGAVDTEKYSYADLANQANLHTGGIAFRISCNNNEKWADGFNALMRVESKSFVRKLPETCQLISEIINGSLFTDKKRLKDLLQSSYAAAEMGMLQSSVNVMIGRLASHLTPASAYDSTGGLPKYQFVKALLKNYDEKFEELSNKLKETAKIIFNRKNMVVGITLKEEEYPQFAEECSKLLNTLPNEDYPVQQYKWEMGVYQEALSSASQVQYVGKGANLKKLGYNEVSGCVRILDVILKYEYFWTKIRIQGGAYGSMTRFGFDGEMIFASYRDPKLKDTINAFDGTADYVRNFEASKREMTKYIIGAISHIDHASTPKTKGLIAQGMWFKGITYEARQKRRKEILSATVGDIRSLAPMIEAAMQENNLCVFGNEVVINENKDLFQQITNVME